MIKNMLDLAKDVLDDYCAIGLVKCGFSTNFDINDHAARDAFMRVKKDAVAHELLIQEFETKYRLLFADILRLIDSLITLDEVYHALKQLAWHTKKAQFDAQLDGDVPYIFVNRFAIDTGRDYSGARSGLVLHQLETMGYIVEAEENSGNYIVTPLGFSILRSIGWVFDPEKDKVDDLAFDINKLISQTDTNNSMGE